MLAIPSRTSGAFREDDILLLRKDHDNILESMQALRSVWTIGPFIQLNEERGYKFAITKARTSSP